MKEGLVVPGLFDATPKERWGGVINQCNPVSHCETFEGAKFCHIKFLSLQSDFIKVMCNSSIYSITTSYLVFLGYRFVHTPHQRRGSMACIEMELGLAWNMPSNATSENKMNIPGTSCDWFSIDESKQNEHY